MSIRKFGAIALAACAFMSVSGCAVVASPVGNGSIFTSVSGPIGATTNIVTTREGKAKCSNILGLIATGDASIDTAKKNGGIQKVASVDYESFSILAIYSSYTVIVRGDGEGPLPSASSNVSGTRFCSSCGAKVASDARFCPNCGRSP
jgi:hypothetical protein